MPRLSRILISFLLFSGFAKTSEYEITILATNIANF